MRAIIKLGRIDYHFGLSVNGIYDVIKEDDFFNLLFLTKQNRVLLKKASILSITLQTILSFWGLI